RVGSVDQIKKEYREFLKSPETDALGNLYLIMVDQYSSGNVPSDIIARYQEHMKEHATSAACFYGIGFALEAMGSFDRAKFNYDEAVRIDSNWYPCYFGLSQIYYQQGDEKKGDHYFYLFEESAPYNVYGNFETHR